MKVKECKKCGKYKDVNSFYKNCTKEDGLHVWCKKCHKEYQKEKYSKKLGKKIKRPRLVKKKYKTHKIEVYQRYRDYFEVKPILIEELENNKVRVTYPSKI